MRKTKEFYTPFGVGLKNRDFSSEKYRYGFNGQERQDELSGEGNSYDFGARMYNSRLGKWLSIDPLFAKYPALSTYCSFGNNPIMYVDPDGRAIMAATTAAETLIKAVFDSFGESSALLFSYTQTTADGYTDLIGNKFYTTTYSQKTFDAKLKEISKKEKWSKAKKEQAKAVFKILNSTDVVEVGLIALGTDAKIDGDGKSDQDTDGLRRFDTNNQFLEDMLIKNSENEMTIEELKTALTKNDGLGSGGELSTGATYGLFRDDDYASENSGKGARADSDMFRLRGALIINVPNESGGGFTYGDFTKSTDNGKIVKSVIEGLSKIGSEVNKPLTD